MAQTKTKTKAKDNNFGWKALSIVLAILMLGSAIACAWGWVNVKHLKEKLAELTPVDGNHEGDEGDTDTETNDNLIVSIEDSEGIKLMRSNIAPDEYEAYGVSAQAESAFTLTATAYNSDGEALDEIQYFNFEYGFVEAEGLDVNEYITVTTTSNTVTVACIKGFSDEIYLYASSEINPSVQASVKIGYYKRIKNALAKMTLPTGSSRNVKITPNYSVSLPFYWGSYPNCFTSETWLRPFYPLTDVEYDTVGTKNLPINSVTMKMDFTDQFKSYLTSGSSINYTFNSLGVGTVDKDELKTTLTNKSYSQSEIMQNMVTSSNTDYLVATLNALKNIPFGVFAIRVTVIISTDLGDFDFSYNLSIAVQADVASADFSGDITDDYLMF